MQRRTLVRLIAGAAVMSPGAARTQTPTVRVIGHLNPGAGIRPTTQVFYAGKILNGANPAGMPVERPTKLLLAVNLKAAAQLSLTVPASILAQATEVIG